MGEVSACLIKGTRMLRYYGERSVSVLQNDASAAQLCFLYICMLCIFLSVISKITTKVKCLS